MPRTISGKGGAVISEGVTVVNLNEWRLTVETGDEEFNVFDADWSQTLATIKKASGSFSGYLSTARDPADPNDDSTDELAVGSEVSLFLQTESGHGYYTTPFSILGEEVTSFALILSHDLGARADGIETVAYNFKMSGAMIYS